MELLPVLLLAPALLAAQGNWYAHFRQGEALNHAGRYAAAEREFTFAVREADQPGSDDWKLPLTLHNLGAVNRELGRNFEAERFYHRAISIWEAHLPERTVELAGSLENLGGLHLALGQFAQAEPLYRRAYELRSQVPPSTKRQLGATLHGLAEAAHGRRRYREAEDLYRRATADLEEAFGPESTKVADVLHNWAVLLRDLHRNTEARPLFERAAAAYDHGGPDHPRLAIILRNLAELEASEGNVVLAAQLFSRAVRICEETLPADHPQTGNILAVYAKFLSETHRKKEGRIAAERARTILESGKRETGMGYTVDASAFRRQ